MAQFKVKTTNSEKGIYFLSLMSCSTNKLKSDTLFTCENAMFSDFTWEKKFCSKKHWEGVPSAPPPLPPPPFFYGPVLKMHYHKRKFQKLAFE